MPIRRRVAIISIFLVGILTIAASCAKLVIQMFVGTEIEKQADISCEFLLKSPYTLETLF